MYCILICMFIIWMEIYVNIWKLSNIWFFWCWCICVLSMCDMVWEVKESEIFGDKVFIVLSILVNKYYLNWFVWNF